MRPLRLVLMLLVVAGLAACGEDDGGGISAGGESSQGADRREVDSREVNCGGSVFDFGLLADAPSVESLAEGPKNAVDDAGAPAFDPSEDWKVVFESDERVNLVRELDTPFDNGNGDVRAYESRTLEKIDGAGNVSDGTWLLVQAGPCAPRLVTESDLEWADLTLASQPAADAMAIDLLVHERACASGRSAEGRIEVIDVEETDDQIRLQIGVRRREGGQTCQGNPATPFTVQLSTPLGDRQIVDSLIVPPRVVTVG